MRARAGHAETGDYGVFNCFMPTTEIISSKRNMAGNLGYPFRGVVHYDTFTYAWCRSEPVPGEKLAVDPEASVQLPAPCQRDQG